MKTLPFIFFLLVLSQLNAQRIREFDENELQASNELSVNAFELIVGGILPINYERYLRNNQSIAVKTFFFDKHYNDMTESDYGTFSLQGQYMIYFSDRRNHSGLYTAPFLKYTAGTATNKYTQYPPNGNPQTVEESYDVNAFVAGFELGYKFVIRNKFTFNIVTDLGRVLNRGEYYGYENRLQNPQIYYSNNYGPVEFRFGVNMGYRF